MSGNARDFHCACCNIRCDKLKRGLKDANIVSNEGLLSKINAAKDAILERKKKPNDNNPIPSESLVCSTCISRAYYHFTKTSEENNNNNIYENDNDSNSNVSQVERPSTADFSSTNNEENNVEDNETIQLNILDEIICENCKESTDIQSHFVHIAPWLFISINYKQKDAPVTIYDLPLQIVLNDLEYNLMCATYNKNAHFYSIFNLENTFYLIDDLNHTNLSNSISKHKINLCAYVIAKID